MNRRERLLHTLQGKPVDRPPVSLYEITGLQNKDFAQTPVSIFSVTGVQDASDPDPYNVYNDPSWSSVLELAREKTDRIVMTQVPWRDVPESPLRELEQTETWEEGPSRFTTYTLRAGSRMLTARSRQDRDTLTSWQFEHLLKNVEDFCAWLDLPPDPPGGSPDIAPVLEVEAQLGDTGIIMLDTPDPLCVVADLFSMSDYLEVAFGEPELFHRALQKVADWLYPRIEAVAQALPGRLWRMYGPEYATPPYLPPRLFHDYVTVYDIPIMQAIHRHGGYGRLHSHGRIGMVLDEIAAIGPAALDPVEAPPQGDIELREVRRRVGDKMVLFGNLEVSDLETLPTPQFEAKVRQALHEGTAGAGRGFVLMPTSCPCGRHLSDLTVRNYHRIIEVVEDIYGA